VECANAAKGVRFICLGTAFDKPCGGDGGRAKDAKLAVNEYGALPVMRPDEVQGKSPDGGTRRDEIEQREAAIVRLFTKRGAGVGFGSEVEDGHRTAGKKSPGFSFGEPSAKVDARHDFDGGRQLPAVAAMDESTDQ
jgi:hypothetical protein